MGLNKLWVDLDNCIRALREGNLEEYYGKNDLLLFQEETSSLIHDLHIQGKTDDEILNIIINKQNTEEKTNEVH
jgi:hypothetical protein